MSPNSIIQAIFPSMFHRRLLLLMVLVVVGMAPLALRLSRLTLSKGAALREDAERRMVRRTWTPTVRGSIVDRRGRVLAQDRPSYDVAVDYAVITGEWVQKQSYVAAKHAAGARWGDMNAAQHEDAIARVRQAFVLHLDEGWTELAGRLGISREELDKRRDQVVAEITRKQEHNTVANVKTDLARMLATDPSDIDSLWKQAEIDGTSEAADPKADPKMDAYEPIVRRVLLAAGDKGKKIDSDAVKSMVKHARQPISEQKLPQVLAWRVSDDVGFSCRELANEQGEVGIEEPEIARRKEVDRRGEAPQAPGSWSLPVDVMPGLVVMDGGDRDYPDRVGQGAGGYVHAALAPAPAGGQENPRRRPGRPCSRPDPRPCTGRGPQTPRGLSQDRREPVGRGHERRGKVRPAV